MGISTIGQTSSGLYSRVAIVTSSSTWTHPDGYSSPRPVKIIAVGGGQGGQGGAAKLATTYALTNVNGGTGGDANTVILTEGWMTSNLSITIGAGSSGGSGGSVSGAAGNSNGTLASAGGSTIVSSSDFYLATGVTSASDNNPRFTGISAPSGGNGQSSYTSLNTTSINSNNSFMVGDSTSTTNANLHRHLQVYNLLPLGGASGGGGQSTTPTTGGTGYAGAGSGGAGTYSTSTGITLTATAGTAATRYGAGGGGGGCAHIVNATLTGTTATGGSGGAGADGVVVIYY